ncbi:hypothetical protein IKF81_01100 [Candidatus Saccharibacteria bacterium]|nr:hypothetical protein [Candidatus Saccharibacteria bacterium]
MAKEYKVETIIRDKDGDFKKLTKYARKKEVFGDGKEVLGGIDWERTEELMEPVEDETLKKGLEVVAEKGVERVEAGDPEFFAAGTAKLVD